MKSCLPLTNRPTTRLTIDSSMLQKIKNQYGGGRSCSEIGTGCSIDLHDLNCVVLKGEDQAQNSEKMCDCFIFDDRDTLTIHLVELKSTTSHASDIEEKFKNSLNRCNRILAMISPNKQYTPKLVLAARSYRHIESRIPKRMVIRINNKKLYHLNLEKCGLKLSRICKTK